MIRQGDALGRPILTPEDQVPNSRSVYVVNPLRQSNPDSTRAHHLLTFLRALPVQDAVERMKNLNLSPKQVKGRDMPNGIAFNNFVQVNNTFCAFYCDAEGLSKTSVLAREVLLFLFYGTYSTKKRYVHHPSCL